MFAYIIIGILFIYNLAILASIAKDIKELQDKILEIDGGIDGKERNQRNV